MGVGNLESVQEEDASGVDELRKSVIHMRQRLKSQGRLLLARRNRIQQQKQTIVNLEKRKDDSLSTIQSQLLIFEVSLKKTQKEFENVILHKEDTIKQQNQLICALSLALVKRGGHEDLQNILPGIKISTSNLEGEKKEKRNRDSLRRLGKKDVHVISSSKDAENLNDSDSAIMMEDAYDSLIVIPVGKGEARVMRSVSDALELVSRSTSITSTSSDGSIGHGSLSTTPSCSSEESDDSPTSTMPKPRLDLLKLDPMNDELSDISSFCSTLVPSISSSSPPESISSQSPSVTPSDSPLASPVTRRTTSKLDTDSDPSTSMLLTNNCDSDTTLSDDYSDDEGMDDHSVKALKGSYEKLNHLAVSFYKKKPEEELIQVTYNRVMSNHRSVTKPKDVKYRRINKAKSRSLEELRGKLKLFDGKHSFSIDLGQSEA